MRFRFNKMKRLPRIRLWAVAVALGWCLLFSLGVFLHYQSGSTLALCTLKNITGIPCPTCGSLRALDSILRGDPVSAFLFNPLMFCAGIFILIVLMLRLVFGLTPKINASTKEKIIAVTAISIVFLANWLYLIADGR
jgi:hypothetical protein